MTFADDMRFLATKSAAGAGTFTCRVPGCRVWIQGGEAGVRAHYAVVHQDGYEPPLTEVPPKP